MTNEKKRNQTKNLLKGEENRATRGMRKKSWNKAWYGDSKNESTKTKGLIIQKGNRHR